MRITRNDYLSVRSFFFDELHEYYPSDERSSLFYNCMEHFFGIQKVDFLANKIGRFSESELLQLMQVVEDLKKEKPLPYIFGEWEFYGLKIGVDEHTLIPRPETEELVQLIIDENNTEARLRILDIGTGSGCIALAIKQNFNGSEITGWDISLNALKKAQENALHNNLHVLLEKKDVLVLRHKEEEKKWDIIVSNPPYIPKKQKNEMQKNVLDYEPHVALFVEDQEPLLFYDAISDFALLNLSKKGKLYFEINAFYGEQVMSLLKKKGFRNVRILADINGKERMVSCIL